MKASTKRIVQTAHTGAKAALKTYKGRPVSLQEAVKLVYESRKRHARKETAQSRH